MKRHWYIDYHNPLFKYGGADLWEYISKIMQDYIAEYVDEEFEITINGNKKRITILLDDKKE